MAQLQTPTPAELAILQVIWERGALNVRSVVQVLQETRDTGRTTVLKLMQIMVDKGLLRRDDSVRPQLFRAAMPRDKALSRMVAGLAERAFEGSAGTLALYALESSDVSAEERKAIRDALDRLEREDGR